MTSQETHAETGSGREGGAEDTRRRRLAALRQVAAVSGGRPRQTRRQTVPEGRQTWVLTHMSYLTTDNIGTYTHVIPDDRQHGYLHTCQYLTTDNMGTYTHVIPDDRQHGYLHTCQYLTIDNMGTYTYLST